MRDLTEPNYKRAPRYGSHWDQEILNDAFDAPLHEGQFLRNSSKIKEFEVGGGSMYTITMIYDD